MAKMNEIPNIFRIGVKQFGAKATKGKVAKRAATEGEIAASVKESVGEALTRVSGNPDGRMRKAQQPAAAAHNQRWFPRDPHRGWARGCSPRNWRPHSLNHP